ncbi:radical SAM protein [Candidatus Margulisiibacteriota bacterium]
MGLSSKLKMLSLLLRTGNIDPLINLGVYYLFTSRQQSTQVKTKPIYAQIEITNVCNLRCKMCAHSSKLWKNATKQKTLKLSEFKHIIDTIPGIFYTEINGVGEPLLHPNIIEMITYAHKKGISTGFFTNATLMTPEISRKLIKAKGLVSIKVSIDTGDPKAFNNLRTGADFNQILDNVAAFQRIKKETGNLFPEVVVSMTAMPEYIRDIPKLVEALKKIGLNSLYIKDVLAHTNIKGVTEIEKTIKSLGLNAQEELADYGFYTRKLTSEETFQIHEYHKEYAKQGFSIYYYHAAEKNHSSSRTCKAPWSTIYINANGDVNPCCFSFLYPEMYFGNILKQSFTEIWNNHMYQDFRSSLKNRLPSCCLPCPLFGQTLKTGKV